MNCLGDDFFGNASFGKISDHESCIATGRMSLFGYRFELFTGSSRVKHKRDIWTGQSGGQARANARGRSRDNNDLPGHRGSFVQ